VLGPVAIGLGIVAIRQIDRSGGAESGKGMAIAGIVTGALGVVLLIGLIALFGFAISQAPTG
jgi:putative effector of murein hydrolase